MPIVSCSCLISSCICSRRRLSKAPRGSSISTSCGLKTSALARALVFNPQLVLMDEPLGALDKRLREQMQLEIKQLHDTMGITVVYVTHDQSEALTMSDRIAVFNDGIVQQIDKPNALYEHPVNSFVANFIGENNVLAGT